MVVKNDYWVLGARDALVILAAYCVLLGMMSALLFWARQDFIDALSSLTFVQLKVLMVGSVVGALALLYVARDMSEEVAHG
jgi:hypothetical protein